MPGNTRGDDSPRRFQRSYTVKKKLEVCKFAAENGGNVAKTARQFGIDRKRVREWVKQEEGMARSGEQLC
jgi:transposase-like protein